jgi:hypothetical protein
VWVDAVDDSAAVPMYEGVVFAKVSRITRGDAHLQQTQRLASR